MPTHVVVLGGGIAGEAFVGAFRRLDTGTAVTLVERELVGGECSYFACMPSKTLLRPPEVVASARGAPGADAAVRAPLDAARLFAWRDEVVHGFRDESEVKWLGERGVELVRGPARVEEPGRIDVAGRTLAYDKLVIATGSRPRIPPIPGLDAAGYWTSRDATSAREAPESVVVLGGGPVGCELGQLFGRLGSRVAIVQSRERLLPREDPRAGELLQAALEREGIEVHCGASAKRVEGRHVHLAGGKVLEAERVLVAVGREPNVEGLGLERLGIRTGPRGIEVDERLRAAENVWAVGDVSGVAQLTHVGKYQARVAARDVAGLDGRADYCALPAVTFTDPQVASVGRTSGDGLVTCEARVDGVGRALTYEHPPRPALLKLFADRERDVLVGAVAVAPEAGEWLGQLTVAVKAEVPLAVLRDTIQPYPTFSETIFYALRDLDA